MRKNVNRRERLRAFALNVGDCGVATGEEKRWRDFCALLKGSLRVTFSLSLRKVPFELLPDVDRRCLPERLRVVGMVSRIVELREGLR